ncbi:iron complex outermembrane recepter protein [Chitinophaga sp. CF118]|uniref:TonB-dependent receptor n=1 Tax=Chitinophaga sp. CF118 TaxID=1884367 RepID=UPI0008F01858|nr:TonB-dependent receptor [Chitinophaga sp. CF118]SFE24742.1 iron complex outermembrane recepter protein [Chitinophaga sp. CF118]
MIRKDLRQFMQSVILIFSLLISFCTTTIARDIDEDNNGIIKGKVVTSDGKPAADVAVILQGTSHVTSTDGSGSFTFRNIQPGSYQIVVSLTGYNDVVKDILVESAKTVNVSFQLDVSSKQLNEIVVTGNQNKLVKRSSQYVSKLPLQNMENPQVYSTITKDLIAQQMIYSVDDAMRNAPGITKLWDATGRSGDGGSYFSSRGFTVQSQLRNGVAGNVTSTTDASNIESIEVIKGPSATLFGSTLTSYGGLINRITKKPYDHLGGEISYTGGSYSYNRFSADINTPLDSAKTLLFRLNTAYTDQGSFTDNGFSKALAFSPSISYKATERLSFQFDAEFYFIKGAGSPFFFLPFSGNIKDILGTDRADELKLDYTRSYFNKDLTQVSRNMNFFASMNYKISDQWTSQTVMSNTNSFSDGAGVYFYLMAGDSLARRDQSTNNGTISILEVQQNFIGDFKLGNMRNRFVGGLDLFYLNSDQNFNDAGFDMIPSYGTIPNYEAFNRRNLDAVYASGAYSSYPYEYKRYTYSAYISDVLNITDNLLVQAALRIDNFDNKGNYSPTTGKYSGGYTQTAFSPKFGIVYQLLKDKLSLFGNYQNGFTNKDGYNYDNERLKPEQANQMEGGVKMDLFEGRLSSTLSYYNIKVKDIVRAYTGANPNPITANNQLQDGTQVSSGFEAQVIANPFQGFSVVAGFAYNDSKLEKSNTDQGRRPSTANSPIAANLWLSYRLSQGALKGLTFGAGGNYASDNKIANSDFAGVFILPAFTVLNASISYDTPKFRIGAKLDNLTNKKYWVGWSSMIPQSLRSFAGSVAFKF